MSAPVTIPSKLLEFPNELVVLIIQLLNPRDFESFRSTNRRIEGLSRSFLGEHQYMKREFSVFETGRHPYGPQDYGRMAGLTTAILNEPRIALYIEVLRILDWYEQWPESMTQAARSSFPIEDLGKVWADVWKPDFPEFYDVIGEYKLFDEYFAAKEGNEATPLELLLLQLPNVRFLELNISRKECCVLWTAPEYMQSVDPLNTLANLETIILTDTGHGPCQTDFFRCLLGLPSVRTVQITGFTVRQSYICGGRLWCHGQLDTIVQDCLAIFPELWIPREDNVLGTQLYDTTKALLMCPTATARSRD